MGVADIIDMIARRFKKESIIISSVVGAVCLLIPVQMASQTWDDHDRSGRYTCRDFGQNYLNTLQDKGNPIIFTNGDNDTFPLWYNQDVEGVRTDARVCNLSYLATDWYIDQMRRPAYTSPSLPITWNRLQYCIGTNDYVEVRPELKEQVLKFYEQDKEEAVKTFGENPFELKNIMQHWVLGNDPTTHVIPTDTVYVTIDKDAVRRSGMMMVSDSIPDRMVISLKGKRALYKNDLMMLEMVANSQWTRPIYVAMTVGEDNYMNLGDNFIQEGLAYRISPFTTKDGNNFDTETTYNNVMNRYKFGGLEKPGIYLDETVRRMCYTHRQLMATLALKLITEGKTDKAAKVLAKAEKYLPTYNLPLRYIGGGGDIARAYALLGAKAKAKKIINDLWRDATQYMSWYVTLNDANFHQYYNECLTQLYIMQQIVDVTELVDSKLAKEQLRQLNVLYTIYRNRGGVDPNAEG